MPNANVIELEACIEDVLSYCEAHPTEEFVKYYQPRLSHAWRSYKEAMEESDSKFVEWRKEEEGDLLSWKHLSLELASVQREMRRLNVVGYPNVRIRHWDQEALLALVEKMIGFLTEKKAAIPGADKMAERLKQLASRASTEARDESQVFREYQRFASSRAEALGSLSAHLWDFRGAMRRQMGKRDATYNAIRWPYSLNPDDGVL